MTADQIAKLRRVHDTIMSLQSDVEDLIFADDINVSVQHALDDVQSFLDDAAEECNHLLRKYPVPS